MARSMSDLTGSKFGRLTVIKQVEKPTTRKNNGRFWLCKCDCGSEKDIIVSTADLNSHHTTSCGCVAREKASETRIRQNKLLAGMGKKNKRTQFYIEADYAYGHTSNTNKKFYIDIDDVDFARKYTWYENDQGYIMSRIDGTLIRLHRMLMNCPDEMDVDHKNHNTYDNRKINLRTVTRSQNNMNKNSKGVCFDKTVNKYMAYIKIDGKFKFLGYFDDESEAIKSRRSAEETYFGEFSYVNSMAGVTTEGL